MRSALSLSLSLSLSVTRSYDSIAVGLRPAANGVGTPSAHLRGALRVSRFDLLLMGVPRKVHQKWTSGGSVSTRQSRIAASSFETPMTRLWLVWQRGVSVEPIHQIITYSFVGNRSSQLRGHCRADLNPVPSIKQKHCLTCTPRSCCFVSSISTQFLQGTTRHWIQHFIGTNATQTIP